MRVLHWNCCGATSKSFRRDLIGILHAHRPDMFFLLGIVVHSGKAQQIVRIDLMGFLRQKRVASPTISGVYCNHLWSSMN